MVSSFPTAASEPHTLLPTELRKQAWASVGVPIFALVSVVLVLALGLLTYFAKAEDKAFEANTQQLVANEFSGQTLRLQDLALDWGHWQDSYDKITTRWDDVWIRETYYSELFAQVWHSQHWCIRERVRDTLKGRLAHRSPYPWYFGSRQGCERRHQRRVAQNELAKVIR